MKSALEIDHDLPLDQLMRLRPGAVRVFIGRNMHCVGCSLAPFHCLKDAAALHGLDEDEIAMEIARSPG